jgi:hypothetical protein
MGPPDPIRAMFRLPDGTPTWHEVGGDVLVLATCIWAVVWIPHAIQFF